VPRSVAEVDSLSSTKQPSKIIPLSDSELKTYLLLDAVWQKIGTFKFFYCRTFCVVLKIAL